MGGRRIARARGIVVDRGSAEVVYVCGSGGSAFSRLEDTEWATHGRRGKGANSDRQDNLRNRDGTQETSNNALGGITENCNGHRMDNRSALDATR
jgi:hypothetical protein